MATNQFWGQKNAHRLISPLFFSLAFHKKLEYRHLKAHTSKTMMIELHRVKFCEFPSSNSEDDGAVCVPVYLYRAKTGLPIFIRCTGIQISDPEYNIIIIIQHLYSAIVSYARCRGAWTCLLYTSPSPRDRQKSRMPSSA